MEEIRKGLAFGIKGGECVILHYGENAIDVNEFLKDEKFWNPKQLFRSPETMDTEWYRANVMKPTDKDMFGNEGTLVPSDRFIIFLSFTKEVTFDEFKWLAGTEKEFRGVVIS